MEQIYIDAVIIWWDLMLTVCGLEALISMSVDDLRPYDKSTYESDLLPQPHKHDIDARRNAQ